MDKQQLISNLLAEVERKIGRTLRTPTDFQYLSLQISKEGKGYESLSISTDCINISTQAMNQASRL